jgi:hypothetical protein
LVGPRKSGIASSCMESIAAARVMGDTTCQVKSAHPNAYSLQEGRRKLESS